MKSFKKIIAILLVLGCAVPAIEARGGGHGGGHGGGRGGFGRGGHGGRGGYYGRGGYGYGGYGNGGAFAGGLIAGTALGAAAYSGYNNYEGDYSSYPVGYNNQYDTQQPVIVDDAMDIE